MNKVYVIRYEEHYSSGEYASGISYVVDTPEKADILLNEIQHDEICSLDLDDKWNLVHNLITENGFIIEYGDDYTKYVIEEFEVE